MSNHPKRLTLPLIVGQTYRMQNGSFVRIVETHNRPHYETVRGDDNRWRYNREGDRGRCTGCLDNHPFNIVPLPEPVTAGIYSGKRPDIIVFDDIVHKNDEFDRNLGKD